MVLTARVLNGAEGEEALKNYLEKKIFPEIGKAPFCVVYVHTSVNRQDNFPGVSFLRSIYESLPAAVRDGMEAVYFVHPGLQARLFFATFGRFLFSAGYLLIKSKIRDSLDLVLFEDGFFLNFRFLDFCARLYGKLRYVSRLEFLGEYMRKSDIDVPDFVHDHDEELERRPLMDYGLESGRHHRDYDSPAMDSAASMYSLRCIS
ncbi:hypothetical protein IEQ34_014631 [Dendrobium chrysotoxum]|uniref:CRAL-TRIO domain-containing protein n=1 Tax=Dendrobium chrysotoxum TaxID=161865 RepID=A0AAV7GMN4_DENCH|nr:hypothetical protein IEQ34_014631 [Dendrobium chrysotoxum]